MKVELNAQDLAGLRSAVARNPRLVLQETGKFLKRGIAAYMQTINQSPWRVGGSPAGSPINKGTLRESHQPASIGTWEAKIEPNRTGKAPYAVYVHEGTRHLRARPWLQHARDKNQNKITQLQNDLLNNVVRDLSR